MKKLKKTIKFLLIKLGLFNLVIMLLRYKTNRQLILQIKQDLLTHRKESEKYYDDILYNFYRINPIQIDNDLIIETASPVAYNSLDHINPSGTLHDNTMCRQFVQACQKYFKKKNSYLDLGCSGGGLVRNFLEQNSFSIGLEGSDISYLKGRAEWSRIPRHLFTADITQPFVIKSLKDNANFKFDVIGAWEVMEHLPEKSIPEFCRNVYNHLNDDGIFAASVATHPLPQHICLHEEDWWTEIFFENGLKKISHSEIFKNTDFPRGGPDDWPPGTGFYIICKKK